jgi:hypothetical protein
VTGVLKKFNSYHIKNRVSLHCKDQSVNDERKDKRKRRKHLSSDAVNCYHNGVSMIDEWNASMKHWWNYIDRGKPKYAETNLSQCQFFSNTNSAWSGVRSNPLFIRKTLRKPRKQDIMQHFFVKASCVCRLQRNRKDFGQLITSCYGFKNRNGWNCSAHAMKENRERRSTASLFLNLRTRKPYVVNSTPRPL